MSDTPTTVSVQRFDRETRERVWCRAKYKRTERYQDSIAVACGGFVILPWGIELGRAVTCPDCLSKAGS